jgi:hypothetical protein
MHGNWITDNLRTREELEPLSSQNARQGGFYAAGYQRGFLLAVTGVDTGIPNIPTGPGPGPDPGAGASGITSH